MERAAICCDMLEPLVVAGRIRTVADIGCGDRKLKRLMEERGWAVSYRGFDIIPQAEDVEPLDLNLVAPPGKSDAAIALGLLEYVDDMAACMRRLADHAPVLVVSHTVRDGEIYDERQIRERGWKNHFYADEFVELLRRNGWQVVDSRATADARTRIWLAERSRSGA